MGIHELVTGLNGAGKSLYTVAQKLKPLVGSEVEYKGKPTPVRLVVGGIKDLLLPHELMEVPELDPENPGDDFVKVRREPGDPPVADMVCSVISWWTWCMPGDVIVIDECQRVFRPMASGKRIPMFIAKLETARHYGVRFVYITQHPNLVHANVRQLVGPIEDVSRVFGSSRTLVRQWDRINDYGKKAQATSRFWKHDKAAFGLYKSAELHTKFSSRIPLAAYAGVGALVALLAIGWMLKGRMAERFAPPVAVAAPGAAASGASRRSTSDGARSARFPQYEALAVIPEGDPLEGRAIQLEGGYDIGQRRIRYFGLVVDGERVATLDLLQLGLMGYSWTELGPCVGRLVYKQTDRLVTCGRRVAPDHRDQSPPVQDRQVPAGSSTVAVAG